MNKKGDIGDIISNIPVLVMVFLIMILFIAAVAVIKASKANIPLVKGSGGGELLLQTVEIEGKKYSIFEGLFFSGNTLVQGEQNEKERVFGFYRKFLSELIKFSDGECLALYGNKNKIFIRNNKPENGDFFSVIRADGSIEDFHRLTFFYKGEIYLIRYYKGGCRTFI